MNIGDSVQDVSRSGPEDSTVPGAVGHGDSHQARSLRTQKPLPDIQDLIDKLAAVTQRRAHHRAEQMRMDGADYRLLSRVFSAVVGEAHRAG